MEIVNNNENESEDAKFINRNSKKGGWFRLLSIKDIIEYNKIKIQQGNMHLMQITSDKPSKNKKNKKKKKPVDEEKGAS